MRLKGNIMGETILAIIFAIIFILFLLSVFGPMHSQKKFWIAIRKIRSIMDAGSYWFYNLCAIATILYIIIMVAYGVAKN